MAATYFVVLPIDRDGDGLLQQGDAEQPRTRRGALALVEVLAPKHAGVLAFSRSIDKHTGEHSAPTILAAIGEIPDGLTRPHAFDD
ncbi:hypothetical protein ACO2RV_04465 [Ancylobacter sp. VNQ12]|uniref:hypothetical protein n=1 Tax=Ancylobacter sp. VNQ12 TaxID=3400920 RepID=UPI003BFC7173